MASLNKVMLMGNLTRDIEMRFTPSGMAIGKFGIAVNRKYKDTKTNEIREEVTFVDVEAYGKTAEAISKYLSKGNPIFIEGRLKLDQWEDKNSGQKRSKLMVVADSFQFIGGKSEGQQTQAPQSQSRPAAPRPQMPRPAEKPPRNDDSIGLEPGDMHGEDMPL